MFFIYILDIISGFVHIYTMWASNLFTSDAQFFVIFYSFTCGATALFDIFFLYDVFSLKEIRIRMSLLKIYLAIQSLIIIIDAIFSFIFGELFLENGLLFIILDVLLIISYTRRLFILKEVRRTFGYTENAENKEEDDKCQPK